MNLRKYKKLKSIIASGIILLTLSGCEAENIQCTTNFTSQTLELNHDMPKNIEEILKEIEKLQNNNLDIENNNEKTTYGLNKERIKYDEKIISPDQKNISYFHKDKLIKKISEDSVWLKTENGSIFYKIKDSTKVYLPREYTTIEIVEKNTNQEKENDTNNIIIKQYKIDGSYKITEIVENEERILEQKFKDGHMNKYYYNTNFSKIPEIEALEKYNDKYIDIAKIIYNSNEKIDHIETLYEKKDSSENHIIYPDGKIKQSIEYYNEKGETIELEETIYEYNNIIKKYKNNILTEEYKDGKRYYYNDNGTFKYYEIKTNEGTTKYEKNGIKMEFIDKNGNRTTYYESGSMQSIQEGEKETTYYESGNIQSIQEGEKETTYYESGNIQSTIIGDTETKYYETGEIERKKTNDNINDNIVEYYKNGKIKTEINGDKIKKYNKNEKIIYVKNNDEEIWYQGNGQIYAKRENDKIEGFDKNGNKIFTIGKTKLKTYYNNGQTHYEIWYEDNEVIQYRLIKYDEEKQEYDINEIYSYQKKIEYYETGKIKNAYYCEKNNNSMVSYYETGQRKQISNKNGNTSFYKNGKKESEIIKNKDGVIEKEIEYYETGKIKSEYDKKSNYKTEYYENGNLKYEGNPLLNIVTENGIKLEGGEKEIGYYENGNLSFIRERNGEYVNETQYYEEGIIKQTKENDTTTYYKKNGLIDKIVTPYEIITYYSDLGFNLYCVYNKTDNIYNYYFNDELIYSSDTKATESQRGYFNSETGENEYKSYILRFENGDYIIVESDGFQIENIEEINLKKI